MKRNCLVIVFALTLMSGYAQPGKDGNITLSSSTSILNSYTYLTQPVPQGSNSIQVASTAGISTGDLILIIQMQGAYCKHFLITGLFSSLWGEVLNYHNSGRWEYQQVNSASGTTIVLDCPLKNTYDTTNNANTQIVRVPRYNQFSIVAGSSLTCPPWNGKTGGIIAIESKQNAIINGMITANGKGFRGGRADNISTHMYSAYYGMTSLDITMGAEKGESIGGYADFYDNYGGQYGRGAPANGGGGGNAHNGGGGGGANAGIGSWNGHGIADSGPGNIYAPLWAMDTFDLSTNITTGGGRGGYSFSMYNQDPSVHGPNNPSWDGNRRRIVGGLGGRPLNNGINSERVFFGGGGGAGDGNDGCAGDGGAGGGIVFILSHASITGSGFIRATGHDGLSTISPGNDAPGGAGGGGSIVLIAANSISGISTYTNGGNGGNQIIFGVEAEGPGGGGGGGYIAHSGGTFNQQAAGGNNGTTNSTSMVSFPPNGATKGANGLTNQDVNSFTINVNNVSICPGETALLTASLNGGYPPGTVLNWYTTSAGGTPFHTGTSWTTPPLHTQTTYYVGSCPGYFREPITVNIFQLPVIDAGPDLSVCIGDSIQLNVTGAVNYLWAPNSAMSNPTSSSPTASLTVTTTYTVWGTDNNGCSNSDQVVVNVLPLPQVTASATMTTICLYSTTLLYATGGVSYIWNTGDTTSTSVGYPWASTIYTVTATDVHGCSNTASVAVTVNYPPILNTSPDTTICFGNAVQLNVGGGISYSWMPSGSLSNDTIPNPIASPLSTTTYTVTAFNNYGCSASDTIIVYVNPLPQVSAGSGQSICLGDTATLAAQGALSYLWSTGDNTQQINVSPLITTIYSVTGTDVNGCMNTDTVTATVLPLPPAWAGNDTLICPGSSVQLNATGGVLYGWSPATDLSSTVIYNPLATPTSTITYTVTVTDANGCSDTDAIGIDFHPLPQVNANADIIAGCPPLTVNFSDTAQNISTWQWNFGDPISGPSNLSNLPQPVHTFNQSGLYSVSLTLTSVHGCSQTGIFTNMVEVYTEPIASFESVPSVASIMEPTFAFTNNSVNSAAWLWHFGDLIQATSIEFEPTYTYNEEGTYPVTLIAYNLNGCSDTISYDVTVSPEYTFFVPNTFTPNGDGINDVFQGIGRNINEYSLQIFDRWGKLVFETDDYYTPWNGLLHNSIDPCMSGVYVYYITVKDFRNRLHKYYGQVYLLL